MSQYFKTDMNTYMKVNSEGCVFLESKDIGFTMQSLPFSSELAEAWQKEGVPITRNEFVDAIRQGIKKAHDTKNETLKEPETTEGTETTTEPETTKGTETTTEKSK